jgi:hypothetical protein
VSGAITRQRMCDPHGRMSLAEPLCIRSLFQKNPLLIEKRVSSRADLHQILQHAIAKPLHCRRGDTYRETDR